MTTDQVSKPAIPEEDLRSFSEYLQGCTRIMALLGAGLSASSGLPTFRGAGGLWRSMDATSLATTAAFMRDPGLVWQFYSYRRHMALKAKPNRAHFALAALAKTKDFITVSQNVDGLSPRAGHPPEKLHLIHGSLYDIKCTSYFCKYQRKDDFTDPIVPALAIPTEGPQPEPSKDDNTGEQATKSLYDAMGMKAEDKKAKITRELDISKASVPIPRLTKEDLPTCPECGGLLRPGVVWFGESLPQKVMSSIDNWIDQPEPVDLMLVIGTSSKVWPAAGYSDIARSRGARIAVINMDRNDAPPGTMDPKDWFFQGDAAAIVPEILKSVVGEIP